MRRYFNVFRTFAPQTKNYESCYKIFVCSIERVYDRSVVQRRLLGKGIAMIIPSAILVFMCTRSVLMILVFYYMQVQKIEKARKWLERIKVNQLWKNQRGYYFFIKGSMDVQTNKFSESERLFKEALRLGLKKDVDKAAVYLNLAVLSGNKNDKMTATMHLKKAEALDSKGYLKNDIKQVKKMLNASPKMVRR